MNADHFRGIISIQPDDRVSPAISGLMKHCRRTITHYDVENPTTTTRNLTALNPYLIEDDGEYCNNLHAGDVEDGYYFILDDYTHVQIEFDQLFMFQV